MEYYLYSIYLNKNKNKQIQEGFSVNQLVGVQHSIAPLLVSIFAAYLCYERNINEPNYLKYLYCAIAFIFSGIYILYYIISYFLYAKNNELILLK
jgi:hypothetical protein